MPGFQMSWRCQMGCCACPEIRRIPAPDHRVRPGQIGGMARHKGFHLIKYALMASVFDNLSLTVVDLSRARDFRSYEILGTTPVTVVGKFAQSDMAELYGMIDVLLAPSVWPESFGLVTREALACGCWVVAPDRGAVGEPVVEGVNGHIVDVADIGGPTSILRQIDGNPEKYRQPPEYSTPLRRSADQADDLAALYLVKLPGNGRRPSSARRPTEVGARRAELVTDALTIRRRRFRPRRHGWRRLLRKCRGHFDN